MFLTDLAFQLHARVVLYLEVWLEAENQYSLFRTAPADHRFNVA